jgi:hypothetical protein
VLFFLMMLLIKVPSLPDWVLPSLGLLLFLLCLLTMFFLLVQGVQAIRQSKGSHALRFCHRLCIHELGYEPRNFREKWLLRFVYWGTILLVAFLLWEYVKAR